MKPYGCIVIVGLLAIHAIAQDDPSNSAKLPKDTVLRARLSETVDVERAKAGDPVQAEILGSVAPNGKIKRPRAPLTLVGHVTEIQVSTKNQRESRLGLSFDKVMVSGGKELTVSAVIERLEVTEIPTKLREWTVPTSGDDPAQRAAGPVSGPPGSRPEPLPHPPLTQQVPTSSGLGPYTSKLKGVDVTDDGSGKASIISSKKHSVVIQAGTFLVLRVQGLEQ